MKAHAKAPGKVILFGEHFVVYGEPSIVMAINRYAHVTINLRDDKAIHITSRDLNVEGIFRNDEYIPIVGSKEDRLKLQPIKFCVDKIADILGEKIGVDITIRSELPVASGLGSSAAVAVATTAALSKLLDLKLDLSKVNELAFEAEKIVHGTPSGVDNTIATYGGIILYTKGMKLKIERAKASKSLPLVIGDTRIPRSTKVMVENVRKLYEKHKKLISTVMQAYKELYLEAVNALAVGDLEKIGELMCINHGLLWSIGVSNEFLDKLVHTALDAGALGAKLTGAGGGGCMIALSYEDSLERIANAIKNAGGRVITALTENIGVKVWVEE